MKKKSIEVPTDLITDFTELLVSSELDNEVAGTTEDGDIIINVFYDSEDRAKVFDLQQWVEDNIEDDDNDD